MNHYEDFALKFNSILELSDINIDEPMRKHTSFKVGGPADILVTPKTFEQLIDSLKLCVDNKVPYFIVGNGSNLLVRDGGIRGVVIKLSKLNTIKIFNNKLVAQSGALLVDVCNIALGENMTGLEFACGIPGTVGGALAMNAGAYNGEMKNVVESATVIDKQGNIKTLSNASLELGYRTSAILKYEFIVLEVFFSLEDGNHEKIKNRMHDLTIRRTERQPLEYPSAGSTFKRPEGHFAAKLIDDTGLRGLCVGDAEVSIKHTGFIINKGNAEANDILKLISLVQEKVKNKFDIELSTEVIILGEESINEN